MTKFLYTDNVPTSWKTLEMEMGYSGYLVLASGLLTTLLLQENRPILSRDKVLHADRWLLKRQLWMMLAQVGLSNEYSSQHLPS